jgi:IS5 family transposase
LRHPLAVLASRMPWDSIETSLAPLLAHKTRMGRRLQGAVLFGPTLQVAGSGVSAAARASFRQKTILPRVRKRNQLLKD